MIADSHCHLDSPELYDQLDDVVKRAQQNNVKYLLTISTTLESFKKIKLIVTKYKHVYGTFGIHPHESKNYKEIDKNYIINIFRSNKKILGVGETGLDFFYNHSDKVIQKKSFIEHIHAASELNVPLIVHTRDAERETYEILKTEKKNSNLKVLIHCFTGTKDFAKKLIDINCHISLSGIITFKNSKELVSCVADIPMENLLIETDSPYLAPMPYRGKLNEPAYIVNTLKKVSEIKKISNELAMEKTTNNFKKLFNIL